MTHLDALLLALAGLGAGTLGSMLGIGGGLIVVPALTNVFHFQFAEARATSLLVVIATACGVAAATGRERDANLRLGITLSIPTALVAFLNALLLHQTKQAVLFALFAGILLLVAALMWRDDPQGEHGTVEITDRPHGPFDASYADPKSGREVVYHVKRIPFLLGISAVAGGVSGLLGVGGGVFQVPALNLLGGVPIRVAAATSNFILGFTASASLPKYLAEGDVRPLESAAVILGVLPGAFLGRAIARRMHSTLLRRIFSGVLLFLAYSMARKAFA